MNLLSGFMDFLKADYLSSVHQQNISKDYPTDERQGRNMDPASGYDWTPRVSYFTNEKVWIWMQHEDFNDAEHPYESTRYLLDQDTSQPRKPEEPSAKGGQSSLTLGESESGSFDKDSAETGDTTGEISPKRPRMTPSHRHSKRLKEQTARQDFRVVFSKKTLVSGDRESITNLGGHVVESIEDATVLVTNRLVITFKVLMALVRCVPIVGRDWLAASEEAVRFLDPWEFLLKDPCGEMRSSLKLKSFLQKLRRRDGPLLAGYSIFVTEHVKPSRNEVKAIILNCGGDFIETAPENSWPENSVIISCEEDATEVKKMKKRPTVVTSHWLIHGIIRQRIKNKKYELAL